MLSDQIADGALPLAVLGTLENTALRADLACARH